MRALLIVIMVALAPLRGWAGDAMAIIMVAQQMPAMSQAQAAATPVPEATLPNGAAVLDAHSDCMGHAPAELAVALDSDGVSDNTNALHCPTCSFCQACSSPGLVVVASLFEPVHFIHRVSPAVGTHFTSAERAPGFKPPIS